MATMVKVNSLVKFYTILLLSEQPKHGYELMKELAEKLDRKISASQVYPFLRILSGKGIIKAEAAGERDKKTYGLTRKGRAFVNQLLGRFGELAHLAVEPRLTVCAHCGCKVYGSAYRKKVRGKELAFCCRYCAGSYSKRRYREV